MLKPLAIAFLCAASVFAVLALTPAPQDTPPPAAQFISDGPYFGV